MPAEKFHGCQPRVLSRDIMHYYDYEIYYIAARLSLHAFISLCRFIVSASPARDIFERFFEFRPFIADSRQITATNGRKCREADKQMKMVTFERGRYFSFIVLFGVTFSRHFEPEFIDGAFRHAFFGVLSR